MIPHDPNSDSARNTWMEYAVMSKNMGGGNLGRVAILAAWSISAATLAVARQEGSSGGNIGMGLPEEAPATAGAWAAVAQEGASVRCGRAVEFYEIGTLKAGGLVWVKERDQGGWATIRAGGMAAGFVPAAEVTASSDGKLVKLNSATRVFYAAGAEPERSWVGVSVDAGTELEAMEKVTTASKGDYYRVRMPAETAGYVLASALREATAEEITAWETMLKAQAPSGAGIEAPAQGTKEAGDAQPTIEMGETEKTAPPGEGGGEGAQGQPAEQTQAQPEQAKPVEPPKPHVPTAGERLKGLEELYQEMRKAKPEDAEVAALQSEYRRLAGEAGTSASVRRACEARIELLQLRLDQQAAQQRLEDAIRKAKEPVTNPTLATPAGELPRYDVIGKLMMSNVYDGKRLQLLYRVQDVSSGRTIAYLVPDDEMQLSSRLNRIVGIIGSLKRDESALIPIVTAKRVDDLKPGE